MLVIRLSTKREANMTKIDNEINDSTNGPTKKKLPTFLKWAIALDVAWAVLVATFAATVLNTAGGVAGATSTAISLATVSAWLIAFVIGLLQGAVFIFVLTVFAWVGMNIFRSEKKDLS